MNNNKKPFYGWTIAGLGSLGNAIQGGVVFWSMGLYILAFEEFFNEPRAKITLIETFLMIATNALSPFIGMAVDKWSVRYTMTFGTLSLGAGIVVCSFAGSMLTIWISFALLIPLGVVAVGAMPTSAVISRWFRKRRGLALGISVAGSSIGGALVPPLVTFLFAQYGWRTGLLSIGLSVMALSIVFYFLLADWPEDKGLEQEEDSDKAELALSEVDKVDWAVRDILRTSAFWKQTLISGSLLAVTISLLANLGLHAKDIGFQGQQIALLYSIIALCSLTGKIGFGYLIDRIGLSKSGLLSVGLMISGLIALSSSLQWHLVAASCVVLGFAIGGVSPTWTNMISRGFGAKSFGRTMGIMNPMHIPISSPAAPLAAYISDTTGSYELVFMIYIGVMVVTGLTLLTLKRPIPKSNPYEQAV